MTIMPVDGKHFAAFVVLSTENVRKLSLQNIRGTRVLCLAQHTNIIVNITINYQ